MGHYPENPFDYIKIYSYHMPLFFLVGGMLLNTKKPPSNFYYNILTKYAAYTISAYIIIGATVKLILHFYDINTGKIFGDGVLETIKFALASNMHGNSFFLVA